MANDKTTSLTPEIHQTDMEPLARLMENDVGQNVFLCYQCGKCSSGCPLVEHMDRMPNRVMRAVQLDDRSVLESKTIWLCVSCQTCTARCPQGIDIAGIMDRLRIEAKAQGIAPGVPAVDLFNKLFLRNIGVFGRVYELGLMAGMNVMSGKPFDNMAMGAGMVKRGRLTFIPTVTRPPREVQPVEVTEGTVAYYPGCSLHSTRAGIPPQHSRGHRQLGFEVDRTPRMDVLRLQSSALVGPEAGHGPAGPQPGDCGTDGARHGHRAVQCLLCPHENRRAQGSS